jgi:hypothetical protein
MGDDLRRRVRGADDSGSEMPSSGQANSYLVEDSVGNYSLSERTIGGIQLYRAQDTSISPAGRKANLVIMRK